MCRVELFNKKASSKKSMPDEILKTLAIQPGAKIADIGSGGGYFSLRFSEAVGKNGQVFSVDTKREFLDHIEETADSKGVANVETVHINEGELPLPDNSCDLIFLRNVYHHLEERVELMKKYKPKLKANGRLAIVEYKPGGSIFHFRRFFGHNVPQKKIIAEMEAAGYRKLSSYDFLPEQSFTIFKSACI